MTLYLSLTVLLFLRFCFVFVWGENRVCLLEGSNYDGFYFPISVSVIPIYAIIFMFRCMMTSEEPYKDTSQSRTMEKFRSKAVVRNLIL